MDPLQHDPVWYYVVRTTAVGDIKCGEDFELIKGTSYISIVDILEKTAGTMQPYCNKVLLLYDGS